jgi:hypothetical protein
MPSWIFLPPERELKPCKLFTSTFLKLSIEFDDDGDGSRIIRHDVEMTLRGMKDTSKIFPGVWGQAESLELIISFR